MTREEAVIAAASLAAFISAINLFFNILASRGKERRGAYREALETSFSELGELLHELMSLSSKLSKMKTDKTYASVRKQVEESAKKLDNLRRKTMYPLWGLSPSLRTMQNMPIYISHTKNTKDNKRIQKILKYGTNLREALDAAIMHSYLSGQAPSHTTRLIVNYKAWRLRRYFDSSNPKKS